MNQYLPKPYYGIKSCTLRWPISVYVDLLLQEQSAARFAAGRLAAALGGAFAGGVLAYSRLVQFMA